MATLGQVRELVTTQLREQVEGLASVVEDEGADFGDIAGRADEIGMLADTIAQIYAYLEQTLTEGPPQAAEQERPAEPEPSSAADDGGATKEELLAEARELDIDGRSSMSKEELAQAVEAEEAVTKEELLERAREAGIEGRSSMTKDELRKALHDARG